MSHEPTENSRRAEFGPRPEFIENYVLKVGVLSRFGQCRITNVSDYQCVGLPMCMKDEDVEARD